MGNIKETAQERRWQAEDDARALITAQELKEDKVRMKRAKDAARKIADEKTKEAKAAKKVSGGKKKHG